MYKKMMTDWKNMRTNNKSLDQKKVSPQKMIIFGFPHCGTSILKAILGHIDDVEEVPGESTYCFANEGSSYGIKTTAKKFVLCKTPYVKPLDLLNRYKDYIMIFLIRNPLFVFSSLNKRFEYKIPPRHSYDQYVYTIKKFINYSTNSRKNIYTIRYEDLFENNYYNLKELINKIGVKYDDSIFDNTKYKNVIHKGVNIRDEKPNGQRDISVSGKKNEHIEYRTWQCNQQFVSNNVISKIDLTENQKKELTTNPYILQVYPDIKSILNSI